MQSQILADLEKLMSFDSSSGSGGAASVASWLASELPARGATLLHYVPGPAATLLARIGPAAAGGIGLAGHMDVVGVAGQKWQSDPFTLRTENNRAYGRGACDMKGFIACALALLPTWQQANLTRPVYLLLTGDEETTCQSAYEATNKLKADGLLPEGIVVGEPTELTIMNRHAGVYDFMTRITGCACHAGRPMQGRSAITAGMRLVSEIVSAGQEYTLYSDANCGFDPPESVVNVGTIHGGSSVNTVPGDCTVEWECRPVKMSDLATLQKRVATWAENEVSMYNLPSAPVTEATCAIPAFIPKGSGAWAAKVAAALGTPNEAPRVAPFATEAGIFQEAGSEVVVCGPGSITNAHKPDEFVPLDDLARTSLMMQRLSGIAQ